MFCSRCGKKVLEYMLFCPFCGAEIVIPDQEAGEGQPDAAAETPEPERLERFTFETHTEEEKEEEAEASAPEAAEPTVERFKPQKSEDYRLSWEDEEADEAAGEPSREPEKPRQEAPRKPERREGGGEAREGRSARARRSANTYVPDKTMDAEDMFMDDISDDYDDYDSFEERRDRDRRDSRGRRAAYEDEDDEDDDDYEDEERGGFLMRHIRGLVGLLLFLVLILVVVLYGLSDSGQRNLARINATLPLDPKLYASLGKESYATEDYRQAGVYYERALAREDGGDSSYNYAQSAVMAYIAAKDDAKAAELLKTCIELNPNAVEPYVYLLNLYPDAANRSAEVQQLIRQGYRLTGDSRLNTDN